MKTVHTISLVITTILLVGCQTVGGFNVEQSKQAVKNADWDTMKTISIRLGEFSFSPSELEFTKGQPYKLEIVNRGTTKHYFTSEEFFKAIATRKVQSNADGEIKAPYFAALEVFPGRSLDLYFVPLDTGIYDLLCTIKGHKEQGMAGTIKIVE